MAGGSLLICVVATQKGYAHARAAGAAAAKSSPEETITLSKLHAEAAAHSCTRNLQNC